MMFKACRLGHPYFEIKYLDFFATHVIQTRLLLRNVHVFDAYLNVA